VTPSTTRPDSRSLDLRANRPGSDRRLESRSETALLPPELAGRWEPGAALGTQALLERLRSGGPAFAWFAPDGTVIAGFCAVARFEGSGPMRFRAARDWLSALAKAAAPDDAVLAPPVIAVGGFSFADGSAGAPAGFGDAVFFVPAELWTPYGCVTWHRAEGDPSSVAFSSPSFPRPKLPEWTEPEWSDAVRTTLRRIESGALDKAVLARAVEIDAARSIDPVLALESLLEANPACFLYFFRPGADASFVGASPERLVARVNGDVVSDAVAGTAADGGLLDSGKDRSEQAFVVRHIVDALAPLCESVESEPEPSLQRHRHLSHLKTRISGRARAGAHVLDFVERLHPTPAVAGSPRDRALELIAELEPSHRGWYAGAVGWMGADGSGDFAVGIRSALIHGSRALLFAGAGIVAGSDPAAEWAETEIKLSVMREAIDDAGR
jgi:menaquinone-specific isochorismate synthase